MRPYASIQKAFQIETLSTVGFNGFQIKRDRRRRSMKMMNQLCSEQFAIFNGKAIIAHYILTVGWHSNRPKSLEKDLQLSELPLEMATILSIISNELAQAGQRNVLYLCSNTNYLCMSLVAIVSFAGTILVLIFDWLYQRYFWWTCPA